MRAETFEFLRSLLNTPTPSGFEAPGQRVWSDYARRFANEVRSDKYGNTIAVVNAGARPKIVLDGHCDEIGLMVKHIDDKGFVYVQPIGLVAASRLPGKRVHIHARKGTVLGVVAAMPPHMLSQLPEDKTRPPKIHELAIDIGAADGKAARRRVAVGDPITAVGDLEMMTDDAVVARGFDDRVGAFAALEALRLIAERRDELDCCVIAHSAVQEEVGIFGAMMSVFNIRPDAAIAIETAICSDFPGVEAAQFGVIALGGGPTIYVGRENHPEIVARFRAQAKANRIPLQVVPHDTDHGTNASSFYMDVGGVPSAVVGIPTRYIHSAIEVSTLTDMERMARLLAAVCLDIKTDETFRVKV